MDSILTSIKKLLGIDAAYTNFDNDLIMHINSVLAILTQVGVGPASGFLITGTTETWAGFIETATDLAFVKSYVYMKVKLLFDPPQSTAAIESLNRLIAEFEWRLNIAAEPDDE